MNEVAKTQVQPVDAWNELRQCTQLFDALPIPATLINAEGIVVDVNPAFLDLAHAYGHEIRKEDRIGGHIASFAATEEERTQFRAFIDELLCTSGKAQHLLWSGTDVSGQRHFWDIRATVLKDTAGEVMGALVLREDVTERKQSEEQQQLLQRVREEVWEMKGGEDINQVLSTIGSTLTGREISFLAYAINLVVAPEGEYPVHVYIHDPDGKQSRIPLRCDQAEAHIILEAWKSEKVFYRPDLATENLYGEHLNPPQQPHHARVRTAIDVPFSCGTLSLASARPGALSEADISFLTELARVLEGGFQRAEDLQRLEQRNRELEEKNRLLTAFHQIGRLVLETLDMDQVLDRLATQIIETGLFRSLMVALVHQAERTVEVVSNYVCLKGSWNKDSQVVPGRFIQTSDRVVLMRNGQNVATDRRIIGTTYSLSDDNITPTVARTGQMEVIEEWSARFDQNAGDPEGCKGKVSYFIPVKKGNQVLAVLATGSERADKKEMLCRIQGMQPLLDYVAIALEHARLYGEVQREIAERQRMEQELIRTQRLRALGELSAGFCHNFNNILVSVLGPAQLLKRYTDQPQVLREAEVIIMGATRARDLVHRLRQAVRGEPKGALYAVSINEGIHQAIQGARPRWKDASEAKGILIEIVTELEDVPLIQGTLDELNDIFFNLLFNAMDAMPEGGMISFRTQVVEDRVQLTVADTGRGMDEEVRRRVFEPFFTTKMDVGRGLGLSTVYGTMTRWGGRVNVESTPGEGTTFTLRFPMWTGPKTEEEETAGDVRLVRSGKLLIVEDDEGVCALLSRLLGETHEVEIVLDGQKALKQFAPSQYDAVLIDLGMPGMSGDRVAREMKKADPALTTVLITGWDLKPDDPRLTPFDFRIQKPFNDLDEVEDVVARAVECRDERIEKNN